MWGASNVPNYKEKPHKDEDGLWILFSMGWLSLKRCSLEYLLVIGGHYLQKSFNLKHLLKLGFPLESKSLDSLQPSSLACCLWFGDLVLWALPNLEPIASHSRLTIPMRIFGCR